MNPRFEAPERVRVRLPKATIKRAFSIFDSDRVRLRLLFDVGARKFTARGSLSRDADREKNDPRKAVYKMRIQRDFSN